MGAPIYQYDLVSCPRRHRFYINVVAIVVVKDEHVGVAGGGFVREAPGLVGEDLAGGGDSESVQRMTAGSCA